jgi:GT2 family glycosyltransferase
LDVLSDCLRSIGEACRSLNVEVIVVDNASSDGTVEAIPRLFGDVQFISNERNRGFPAANNQGIRISSGRNILLLNPDTLVYGDAIRRMLQLADSHEEIGLIGPRLIGGDGSIQYVCARSFPTPLNWLWYYSFLGKIFPGSRLLGGLLLSYWDHKDSRPVDAITGAAMLIPRRTLERVGLLDEAHAMYLEDLDYCYRVHQAGFQVQYLADALIVHYGGQSSSKVSSKAKLLSLEAHWLFFQRYGRGMDKWIFRLVVAIVSLIRLHLLSVFRLCSILGLKVRGAESANLESEMRALLWGVGLDKSPEIETVRL